jgi:hypothetical protein
MLIDLANVGLKPEHTCSLPWQGKYDREMKAYIEEEMKERRKKRWSKMNRSEGGEGE